MMSNDARKRLEGTNSSSFACDLKKWMQIMEAYEAGGHAYHATMPTDALVTLPQFIERLTEVTDNESFWDPRPN